MKAIRFKAVGGPEVLSLEEVTLPPPAAGQLRVRHKAVGVNFIDIYHRKGVYKIPLPSGLGLEASGIVEDIGEGVKGFSSGDRVAYCSGLGAYAESTNIAADKLIRLPDSVGDDIAAAVLLKGLTAQYLLKRTYPVKPGTMILYHSAAGGVGQIACQWAKHLGAIVIGTVGNERKVEAAKRAGCDHVVITRLRHIVPHVRELTQGKGVDVVYDSVGEDTFEASLDCLKPRGMLVSFGNASGTVPPVDPMVLSNKGSLFFTRPKLADYIATHEEMQQAADDLFAVLESGAVKVAPPKTYPLADAAKAHADLESRRTMGQLVLIP